ncbi:MAG: hypothetical protein JW863_10460 [Chitinispirillaceae bacterium]|nr:hypothetical protein [Chitinispirillaceae bacterium]
MNYGYFDDNAREYVITDPKTPVKWINYIGTLAFGGFVDHTGGALICKGDPSLNRITKYIQQMPSGEFKGETLYVRIKTADGYTVFSPFYVPTLDAYDLYECHVGLGYSRILSEFYGVRTECTVFVPSDAMVEIRDIRVTNISGTPLEIDIIPVVEYTHPDAVKQFTNADWVPQTMQSDMIEQQNGLKILTQYPFMFKDTKINYFTSNFAVSSFETDRKLFLGNNEYCTWAKPLSLQSPELSNYQARRGDNIAALLHHCGVVEPGKSQRIITQLGQASSIGDAQHVIHRFRDPVEVEQSLGQLAAFWQGHLDIMQVKTPEAAFNSMLNVHNPRQCFITYNWSRYLSYYQLGLGTRGLGFRDSSQDVMGVVDRIPDEAKKLIVKLLSVQRRDGAAMHQFNPLSMEASLGDAPEMPDRPQFYGDDHLWIILAVTAYIKETGETDFLQEKVPFYEKDREGNPLESETVFEHLQRSLAFTKSNLGRHGLPLLGFADWNDCVNLPTGAESIFNACLYGKALSEMIELTAFLGRNDLVDGYQADFAVMKKNFTEHSWDGDWFVRYFEADGAPLGSQKNSHGKIYLNGQSWPVIAGLADPDRGRKAMDSAREKLNTSKGLKLSTPGFNGFDPTKGGITTYPPGAKENCGIFLHTNPWMMIAETILGDGDRAYQYYDQINPAKKNEIIDEYELEPYVYAQNILGDEHPQFGLARNSWLSGTSSWVYQAATKYILGILPQYEGLKVDPCIPAAWETVEITRKFRGTTYVIKILNPDHVKKGVVKLTVNGKTVEGATIPHSDNNGTVSVEVVMG